MAQDFSRVPIVDLFPGYMHKCPPIYLNWRDFCQCAANEMPMGSDPVLDLVLYDGNCSKLVPCSLTGLLDWHWIGMIFVNA